MYALAVEGTAVTDSAIVLADSYLQNDERVAWVHYSLA